MSVVFYKNLYISPNIHHPEVIKWRLKHNAGNLALWVLTYSGASKKSEPGGNQLEFFHCMFLHQPYYRKRKVLVIGIAEGRAEAIDLVAKITRECLEKTHGTDLKAYLFPEAQEGRKPVQPLQIPCVRVRSGNQGEVPT